MDNRLFNIFLELSEGSSKSSLSKDDIFGGWITHHHNNEKKGDEQKTGKEYYRWQNVVETSYMLHIVPPSLPPNCNTQAISHLNTPPPNWSMESDEELVGVITLCLQKEDGASIVIVCGVILAHMKSCGER